MKIKHTAVQEYLKALGWTHVDTIRHGTFVFRKNGVSETILIPTNRQLSDYKTLIETAINTISEAEQASVQAVRERILYQHFDIIRFKIETAHAKDGTLPLDIWAKHYSLTINSIRSAAHTIFSNDKSKPTSKRITTSQAAAFASRCKIGQTEIGSYTTKAIIPLDNIRISLIGGIDGDISDAPSGRQLSIAILNSANIISNAASQQNRTGDMPSLDELTNNNPLAKLTYRLCSAYEELCETSKNKTNLHISLQASQHVSTGTKAINTTSKIESKDIESIKFIRQTITKKFLPTIDTLEGFITKLEQDTSDPGASSGKITLFTNEKKVSITLDDTLYKIALSAHAQKIPVAVRGVLKKENNRWQLENIEELIAYDRHL